MSLAAIPNDVKEAVQDSQGFDLLNFHPSTGGCINNGGRLDTSKGPVFLKWNHASTFPAMFAKEELGLKLLQSTNAVRVPSVVAAGQSQEYQFIIMEWIASRGASGQYWENLGHHLATLHRHTSDQFGLDHDNYIGSLPQHNSFKKSWTEFFILNRLEPQAQMLHLDVGHRKKLDRFYVRLPDLIPEDKPALLHGDLWSGNILADETGDPVLIDPAVYYGHREAEIAFTQLFGGFQSPFYEAYEDAYSLPPDHHKRVELFNIYPLFVHANLFGGSYLSQAFGIIDRWA